MLHHLGLAMDQEGAFRLTESFVPSQQLRLIGMGGKAIDGMNLRPHRDLLSVDLYRFGTIDDTPGKGANGGEADEHDT